MNNPEGAAFLELVMKRVGAANPTDLSKTLGEPWTSRDQQRKLYKWARGESAPNFQGTIALLRLAGMLNEEDEAGEAVPVGRPSGSTDARLQELSDRIAELPTATDLARLGESMRRAIARASQGTGEGGTVKPAAKRQR